METTDISDRDANNNNDEINNNYNNETINILLDPIDNTNNVNTVDDNLDFAVTSAVDDVAGVVADTDGSGTVSDTGDAGIVAETDDVDVAGSSDTFADNSNNNNNSTNEELSETETEIGKIDTTATISNNYDNEVIIDSNDEDTNNVEDDNNDKNDNNEKDEDNNDKDDNDKDNDNNDKDDDEHQSSMFNPILSSSTRSDNSFSPTNSATQLPSSSSKDVYSDRKTGAKLDAIDLCYSVIINGKLKKILKNINFSLEPGCMCALLGSSTAGKR